MTPGEEKYLPTADRVRRAWVWGEERVENTSRPEVGPVVTWEREGNRLFGEWLRGIQAEAWEEGREAGRSDTHDRPAPNPYLRRDQ